MSSSHIYGFHAISKFLQHSAASGIELFCVDTRNPRLLDIIGLARKLKLPVSYVERDQLARLAQTDKHQNCVLKINASNSQTYSLAQSISQIHPESLFLVLDGVQDPHNLGACLRTADAVGVDAVIIPKDRAAKLTPVVRKVAAGGAESIPLLEVTNIARSLQALKQAGVWIYGATGEAERSLYEFKYDSPIAIVMGAEGAGLRRLTMDACDYLIKLPMNGVVESLNVSVATGICLYEVIRSRMACSQQ